MKLSEQRDADKCETVYTITLSDFEIDLLDISPTDRAFMRSFQEMGGICGTLLWLETVANAIERTTNNSEVEK